MPRNDDGPTCELLGPVSLVLQLFLGGIAIMSLVLKRKYEHPRRPWKVWLFDVLKQVIGAMMLHVLNVIASIVFSDDDSNFDDNPCIWYFLNVLFDTTIGVPLLWLMLWYVYFMAFKCGIKDILSGEYGTPPRKRAFAKQLILYLSALILAKIVLGFVLYTVPFLDDWGAYLIGWTDCDQRLQIGFVMLVFPTIMNAIQYYVIDSIIQSPQFGDASESLTPEQRQTVRRYGSFEAFKRRVSSSISSRSSR